MKTREEIKKELEGNLELTRDFKGNVSGTEKGLTALMAIAFSQHELLLDIRDLLANPPVEISGEPVKINPTPHTEEKE